MQDRAILLDIIGKLIAVNSTEVPVPDKKSDTLALKSKIRK